MKKFFILASFVATAILVISIAAAIAEDMKVLKINGYTIFII